MQADYQIKPNTIVRLIITFIRHLFYPRVRALLRREYPCLSPALTLILGQLLAISVWSRTVLFILAVACALLSIAVYRKVWAFFPLMICVGCISVLSYVPAKFYKKAEAIQFAVQAQAGAEIRFNRDGLLQFNLKVLPGLGKFQNKELAEKTFWCQVVNLPWRNSASLEAGAFFYANITIKKWYLGQDKFEKMALLRGIAGTCQVNFMSRARRQMTWVMSARKALKQKLLDILGDNEGSALLRAMAIGERDLLSRHTEEAFRRAGLSHLLVVSGYHVTAVFIAVLALCGLLMKPLLYVFETHWLAYLCRFMALLLALVFISVAGWQCSSARAGIAAVLATLAFLSDRDISFANTLAVALIAVALVWPGAVLEVGVQLTFAALSGIAVALPDRGSTHGFAGIAALCKVSFAASAATTIVSLLTFGSVSLVSVPLNIVVAPLATVLFCKGAFLGLILEYLGLDHGFVLELIWRIAYSFRRLIWAIADWPYASVEPNTMVSLSLASVLAYCLIYILSKRAVRHFQENAVFHRGASYAREEEVYEYNKVLFNFKF